MQTTKKCARCNMENDSSVLYCVKCGNYLPKKTDDFIKHTIWDSEFPAVDPVIPELTYVNPDKYVVKCRQCGCLSEAPNGAIPLSCNQCGYFFQMGIDTAVLESSLSPESETNGGEAGNSPQKTNNGWESATVDTGAKHNPLKKAVKDNSRLRLIAFSRKDVKPEQVSEQGEIIGSRGTVLRTIKTEQLISISHTATGWYARALTAGPLVNGVFMTAGIQMKLNDDDIITIEREQIRVEITKTQQE